MHSLVVFPGVAMTHEGLGDAPKDFARGGFEEGGWDTSLIALFFTLIFRSFSQPCHLHTCSLVSLFSCYQLFSTLLLCYQLAIHFMTLTNSYDLMTIPLYSYSSFTLFHPMK